MRKERKCSHCGRSIPSENQICPYCGGEIRRFRLPRKMKRVLLGLLPVLLVIFLTNLLGRVLLRRLVNLTAQEPTVQGDGKEFSQYSPGLFVDEINRESMEYYTPSQELEEEIYAGFWNRKVNWGVEFPEMNVHQIHGMEWLNRTLPYGTKTEQQVLAGMMEAGCSREEAEQALEICPIDFNMQAMKQAAGWLKNMGMCREQLIKDLLNSGFTRQQAEYAADHLNIDWNQQAKLVMQRHLLRTGESREKMEELLILWDFTPEQARHALEHTRVDWNRQAAKAAGEILQEQNLSRQELIQKLEERKFTHEQAVYGADEMGIR